MWKIIGEFGEHYFVGRKRGSLFVSYSRQYPKADREPLLFVFDHVGEAAASVTDDGPKQGSYGQSSIRVFQRVRIRDHAWVSCTEILQDSSRSYHVALALGIKMINPLPGLLSMVWVSDMEKRFRINPLFTFTSWDTNQDLL